MSPREIRLSTTPTPEAIAALRLGDIVYLDGLMYTAREGVYMRALEERANIPMELPRDSAANFHCSPAATIPSPTRTPPFPASHISTRSSDAGSAAPPSTPIAAGTSSTASVARPSWRTAATMVVAMRRPWY